MLSSKKLPTDNFLCFRPDMADHAGLSSARMPRMDYVRARKVLRERRAGELRLSVPELAQRAGMSKVTIYRLEDVDRHPDRQPDFETIERLCAALNLPLSEFFARVEGYSAGGAEPIQEPSQAIQESQGPHVGSDTALPYDDSSFYRRLADACADAANAMRDAPDVSQQFRTMAVGFEAAADQAMGHAATKRAIHEEGDRKRRER